MTGVDEFLLKNIRLYFDEDAKLVKVRDCPNGAETDYDLDGTCVGVTIENDKLFIGPGKTLDSPISLPTQIPIHRNHVQGFFAHLIDSNASSQGTSEDIVDVEFVGAGDDRDECDLITTGKPRDMFRFRLSELTIQMKIVNSGGDTILQIWYESDASTGLDHMVTTNLDAIH